MVKFAAILLSVVLLSLILFAAYARGLIDKNLLGVLASIATIVTLIVTFGVIPLFERPGGGETAQPPVATDDQKSTANEKRSSSGKQPLEPLLVGEFANTLLWEGGQDAQMSSDVDADGLKENIIIGRNHPNGTKFLVLNGEEGYNLGHEIRGLGESGGLKEGFYCEVGVADVTQDGSPEILLAVGNGLNQSELNVWRFDEEKWATTAKNSHVNPFSFVAHISGQRQFRILPGGKIRVPIGSQGLYNEYVWDGEGFART